MSASSFDLSKAIAELPLPADRVIAHCGVPPQAALADVGAATARVLADPLNFPPLAKAVVPGDRVVLALDQHVQGSREILAELIRCLTAHGVQAGDITVLTVPGHDPVDDMSKLLLGEFRDSVKLELHDPQVRDRLAYLAVGEDDQPIYLNRLICEADVVLPIGTLRCEPALDYHGKYGGLFPTFSSRKVQDKIFAAAHAALQQGEARNRQEIQQVGWLLGVQFTVQVVPGPAGEPLQVLAGDPASVFATGQEACQQAWTFAVPRSAPLVIATIDGGAAEQTWDNTARALSAALRIVSPGGAIAICTSLADPPGPTLRRAGEGEDFEQIQKLVRRERLDDASAALVVSEALSQTRIYLRSQLRESDIEDLSMSPLGSDDELRRLAEQFPACILLSNAQYAVPTVGEG